MLRRPTSIDGHETVRGSDAIPQDITRGVVLALWTVRRVPVEVGPLCSDVGGFGCKGWSAMGLAWIEDD